MSRPHHRRSTDWPDTVRSVALKRMDNVGIVVDDLDAAKTFFSELGLELEGEMTVDGDWASRVVGIDDMVTDVAMMRTPDGNSRIELMSFQQPVNLAGARNAPPNTHGIRRIMFAVDDIDEVLDRLGRHGAELVGEVMQYEDTYRLCYLRGPEGIIIALAQELG